MVQDGHRISVLHADFDGPTRDEVLSDFRSSKTKVLITTNVLARGIDVSSVSMVINYDIPMKGRDNTEPDAETYLHRIGRTGRFGRIGVSVSFVYDQHSYRALETIAEQYGIDLVQLSTDDWDDNEIRINRIIKHNRARAAFAPHVTERGDGGGGGGGSGGELPAVTTSAPSSTPASAPAPMPVAVDSVETKNA